MSCAGPPSNPIKRGPRSTLMMSLVDSIVRSLKEEEADRESAVAVAAHLNR